MMTKERDGAGAAGPSLSAQADPRRNGKRKALGFIELLETHRRGDIITAAEEALQEVTQAVIERGGKGGVSIKLAVSLDKGGVIKLVPSVEAKKPAKPISDGFYFDQGDGLLGRFDPRQSDIEDFS